MGEELRRQVEALKAKLHADGVSDYQRYEAIQILTARAAATEKGTSASV